MALNPNTKLLESLRSRRRDEGGFTLIELMVVVLVIAILLAIAIPTFLGARERSQDRSAQSNLRNALTAAKVAYSNDGDYSMANDTSLNLTEPNLTLTAAGSSSPDEDTISVQVTHACGNSADQISTDCLKTGSWVSANTNCVEATAATNTLDRRTSAAVCTSTGQWIPNAQWSGAVWSDSETCWYIRDNSEAIGNGGTKHGDSETQSTCTAVIAGNAATITAPDW